MKIGRIIGTAVAGLVLFLFLGIDLALFGVVSTSSPVVTAMAIIGLVLGAVAGVVAGRRREAALPRGTMPPPPPAG